MSKFAPQNPIHVIRRIHCIEKIALVDARRVNRIEVDREMTVRRTTTLQ
jgi:hypothetical protein